jgi:hypothetical protein
VLKGAALFTLWTGKPHRATRDLDLLGFGDPGEGHVREVFGEVLALDVADDGVRFPGTSLGTGRPTANRVVRSSLPWWPSRQPKDQRLGIEIRRTRN